MTNPWFPVAPRHSYAALRLFCFAYAGGKSTTFRTWSDSLPVSVEVVPVELPGRGARIRETPYAHISPLVRAIAKEMLPLTDKPFAFFGHSMGALVSFELTRMLRREHGLLPEHLFVSAHRAPQLPDLETLTYSLPEQQFIEKLKSLNGTPAELFSQPELMRFLLPILRADFEVCNTYSYRAEAPLDCPISVFGGLRDIAILQAQLGAWRAQTTTSFSLSMLPGDHFYLNTAPALLLRLLSQELQQIVRVAA